eukprot:SAG25_NODE_7221_length_495_cov_1.101010_1_plen_81_part_00
MRVRRENLLLATAPHRALIALQAMLAVVGHPRLGCRAKIAVILHGRPDVPAASHALAASFRTTMRRVTAHRAKMAFSAIN